MAKKQKGITSLLIIIILVVLIAVVLGLGFFLSENKRLNFEEVMLEKSSPTPSIPVSSSDDLDAIEVELDGTDLGSFEADFVELNTNASSL